MDYASIKATIDVNIKANGNEEITGSVLNGVLTDMLEGTIVREYYDTDDYPLIGALVSSTGTWSNVARYRHILIPVEPGWEIQITANNTSQTTYAFLTSDAAPVNNQPAPLVAGTTRMYISAGNTGTVIVPNTAKFLYLYSGDLNEGSTHTRDRLPSVVCLIKDMGYLIDAIDDLKVQAQKITYSQSVDLAGLPILGCQINSSGNWLNWSRYKHIAVPIQSGDLLTIQANSSYATYYAFLTNDEEGINGEAAPLVSGTSRVSVAIGTTVEITAPEGARYLYLYGGDRNQGNSHVRDYVPAKVIIERDVAQVSALLGNISRGIAENGDVTAMNPDGEWLAKMQSAKKRYYTSTVTDKPVPVVFAHISDVHSNWVNVRRFLEFCHHHSAYIDDMLNTGDIVLGTYEDGLDGYKDVANVREILNVVGNHDTRGANGWQDHIGLDAYNALIAPYVSYWGVTQPSDAAANGYCYYYKDYAAQSLRLLVVDIMSYNATQDAWVRSVLADSLSLGYHTVIATHFSSGRTQEDMNLRTFDKINCNYTTLQSTGTSSDQLYGYNPDAYLLGISVDAYIQGGGVFVGYIQGHYHLDFLAKSNEYPDQLIYSVGAGKAGELRDWTHVPGTRSQDEFQIISIDTYQHIVKLFKVGANVDIFARHKNSVCINYYTGEIVAEGF